MRTSRGLKQPARDAVEKLARKTALWSASARSMDSALDLAVASAAQAGALVGLCDPVAAVEFLRASWGHSSVAVECVRDPQHDHAAPEHQRLATLLETLASGLPPFTHDQALLLCRQADALRARREPFVRPTFVADAGLHASIASSYAKKGRLLATLVRFLQPEQVVEIGTAYGMSALFLATELSPAGRIVTVEASHPQIDIAREVIAGSTEADRIQLVEGFSHEVREQVAAAVPQASLLFHDGEHSGDAYVRDFTGYLPLLQPGSVVLFDDIRWDDPRWRQGQMSTYAGWRQLVSHERIRAAYELDGELGLLALR